VRGPKKRGNPDDSRPSCHSYDSKCGENNFRERRAKFFPRTVSDAERLWGRSFYKKELAPGDFFSEVTKEYWFQGTSKKKARGKEADSTSMLARGGAFQRSRGDRGNKMETIQKGNKAKEAFTRWVKQKRVSYHSRNLLWGPAATHYGSLNSRC